MNWRIHLSSQAIRDLQILAGEPRRLAVWTQTNHVELYDLAAGIAQFQHQIDAAPVDRDYGGAGWQTFLLRLSDLAGMGCPPRIPTAQAVVYSTADGRSRLFYEGGGRLLMLADGRLYPLGAAAAVDLHPTAGVAAVLDGGGRLSIYRQGVFAGRSDLGLRVSPLRSSAVCIASAGGCIFVSDGRQIVKTDMQGALLRRLEVHYGIRQIACSPDGGRVVTSDSEAGLLRAYRGADLWHSHQRFAQDLVAAAQQVQLLAELPPVSAGISALVLGAGGALGFAMAGVVCMTNVNRMTRLPVL